MRDAGPLMHRSTLTGMVTSTPGEDPVGGVLVEERVELQEQEPGDHERFSHYVKKEKILEATINGTPVKALCGKKWVPTRDPGRFPVCPECKEIFERMPGGDDSGDGSGS